MKLLLGLFAAAVLAAPACAVDLTGEQRRLIGKRIWLNEGGGKAGFLTHWNEGEAFASMGIGHFIWYPAGRQGQFAESFPGLVAYLSARGRPLPAWTHGPCPWDTKQAFLADYDSPRVTALRAQLAEPEAVALQTSYIIERLEQALPAIMRALPAAEQTEIKRRFDLVAGHPVGAYALIDYVNFKGEGTKTTERYPDERGLGWGLLQALQLMDAGPSQRPNDAFADGAQKALTRRVANCPPPAQRQAQERKWLAGWVKRLATYRAGRLEDLVAESR